MSKNQKKQRWILPVIIALVVVSSAVMFLAITFDKTDNKGNILTNEKIEYVNYAVYIKSDCKFESHEDGSGSGSCGMGIGHGCLKAIDGMITLANGQLRSITSFEDSLKETYGSYSLSVTEQKGLHCD